MKLSACQLDNLLSWSLDW